jgi:hypothetical protein
MLGQRGDHHPSMLGVGTVRRPCHRRQGQYSHWIGRKCLAVRAIRSSERMGLNRDTLRE